MIGFARKVSWILVCVFAFVGHAAYAAPGAVSDGLQVWLRAGDGITVDAANAAVLWEDLSGNGHDAVYDPNNVYFELPPAFVAANPGAANQATLRFDNQHALAVDLTFLAGSDYTIFVVNGRDRFGLANFYLGGTDFAENTNLTLGYEDVGLLRQSHFINDLDATVAPYVGTPLWAIDSFRLDQQIGRDIHQNGVLVAVDTSTEALITNAGSALGHFRAFGDLFWFQGDLAEVVVYDRALTDGERRAVELDLSTRYALDYDTDGDGWRDGSDNCSAIANPAQIDSNADGFGNACDTDLNDDGITNASDLGAFKSVFFTADADADFNSDGVVNALDLGILRSFFFLPPGPSGLAE